MSTDEKMYNELVRIREVLEPKPTPAPKKPANIIQEFKEFLKQYKVFGLAVAFIMGIYLGRLVQALVTAFISPVLTIIFLVIGFVSLDTIIANPTQYPFAFNPVLFISELITFIIVALVIFILVKITARMGID